MIIDILFLMIFLIMGVFGMRKGFIESLTDFLNLVVGISIALFFYVDLSFFISKYVSINHILFYWRNLCYISYNIKAVNEFAIIFIRWKYLIIQNSKHDFRLYIRDI